MTTFTRLHNELMTELAINEDNTVLRFTDCFGIQHHFMAVGDCCSQSWVEHIDGVEVLSSATITEMEDVGGDEDETLCNQDGHEYVKVYFFKFKTTLGYATIEMRNSSNGYYGGEMQYLYPDHLNHVLSENFRVLTEDF
jgi:hypothetical protein